MDQQTGLFPAAQERGIRLNFPSLGAGLHNTEIEDVSFLTQGLDRIAGL